jgi:hypothetical protein
LARHKKFAVGAAPTGAFFCNHLTFLTLQTKPC